MRQSLILLLMFFLFPMTGQAQEFAGVLGINQSTFDPSTGSSESGVGLQGGLQYYYLVGDQVFLRTGAVFTQRKADFGLIDVDLLYLDVPITIEYRLNDFFGFFAGFQLAILLSDECSTVVSCSLNEPNSMPIGIPVGINLIFDDRFGMDIYYIHGVSEAWNNVDWANSLGAQFLYKF